MAEEVARAVTDLPGTEEGRQGLSVGAGGDRTFVVDRRAEDAVVRCCERLAAEGMRFLLRSEELGERDFGAPTPVLLVDPMDGSLNAKQGIPYYCTSLALVDGTTLGDTVVGVVRSLAAPTVFTAVRGQGAERDGRPLRPLGVGLEDGRIPMLLVESFRRPGHLAAFEKVLARTRRVRVLGAAALSLCQVAAGSGSVLLAPDGLRSYDCAAGLLVLHESGAVVTDAHGEPLETASARLEGRVSVLASHSADLHRMVLDLLR